MIAIVRRDDGPHPMSTELRHARVAAALDSMRANTLSARRTFAARIAESQAAAEAELVALRKALDYQTRVLGARLGGAS